MKFERTYVSNFENAFRGLRNPLESWAKSDSVFGIGHVYDDNDDDWFVAEAYCEANNINVRNDDLYYDKEEEYAEWLRNNGITRWDGDNFEYSYIGPKDLDLAHRMIKAGTSDSKFLRQINVSVDITAPLYWWSEFDTYKIGTVANSTSKMHKLSTTPITLDRFETDDYNKTLPIYENICNGREDGVFDYFIDDFTSEFIKHLEALRKKYLETKDKRYWKELIRWLPEGWLQTRTVTMNYAVLRNIYFQRLHHKLSEWRQFCDWVESLPYAADLIIYTGKN